MSNPFDVLKNAVTDQLGHLRRLVDLAEHDAEVIKTAAYKEAKEVLDKFNTLPIVGKKKEDDAV